MGKKCLPGIICIENMTLFLLFFISVVIIYMYYVTIIKNNSNIIVVNTNPLSSQGGFDQIPGQSPQFGGISTRQDTLSNPYAPPLKHDGVYFPSDSGDIRGLPRAVVPINVQTRSSNASYSQVGILTRTNGGSDMILPLMGRRTMNGRDKYQYYTISNTGNLNTKLPVSLNGKSCTGEYGCDEISNSDVVYVEGYNDTFRATIYENGLFSYMPVL